MPEDKRDWTPETRRAPVWAWAVIDETLQMDALSNAFDKDLRVEISRAYAAMETVTSPVSREEG